MDSENQQQYSVSDRQIQEPLASSQSATPDTVRLLNGPDHAESNYRKNPCNPVMECSEASEILSQIKCGHVLMVNTKRRNGLILCKTYHAEFAGPGAAVGSFFDLDCERVIPVGDLSLIAPQSHDERQRAYLIRRQWIRLTQQFTDKSQPQQRAQMILTQFENYFDQETIERIPDEAFALLVGVLPYTIRIARRRPGQLKRFL